MRPGDGGTIAARPPALRPGGVPAAEPFARHGLVWLDPAGAALAEPVHGRDRALLGDWIHAGRPLVFRRDEAGAAGADSGRVALGLPLPSRLDRRRIALRAPRAAIARHGRMPLLAEAGGGAFSGWRAEIGRLGDRLADCGAAARVYGSLGWQHLTGESYLHADSDIDLLIQPGPGFDADRALDLLAEAAGTTLPRFDGEIVLAPDRAVAWREMTSGASEVLVRGLEALFLLPRPAARSMLRQEIAA